MRFKYTGQSGYKDLDLVVYKIMSPNQTLKKGDIIEIPDDMAELIQRVQINGNFEKTVKITAPKKPKKEIKEEKQEEEDK